VSLLALDSSLLINILFVSFTLLLWFFSIRCIYDINERQVSCSSLFGFQFRALSDQLFETPDKHMFVRRRVVWQVSLYIKCCSHLVYIDRRVKNFSLSFPFSPQGQNV
jgi:hypothetical protein